MSWGPTAGGTPRLPVLLKQDEESREFLVREEAQKEFKSTSFAVMHAWDLLFSSCLQLGKLPDSLYGSFSLSIKWKEQCYCPYGVPVTEPYLGLLARSAAKPMHWHWAVVKKSTVFIAWRQAKRTMFKRPELPSGFQGRGFKDSVTECVTGCGISSWTVLWLVDGEVTGWCFRNLYCQPSGLGSTFWWPAYS